MIESTNTLGVGTEKSRVGRPADRVVRDGLWEGVAWELKKSLAMAAQGGRTCQAEGTASAKTWPQSQPGASGSIRRATGLVQEETGQGEVGRTGSQGQILTSVPSSS